jgi:hypothetical protein
MSASEHGHVHVGDEELLQVLLEPAPDARRKIEACADCSRRSRELAHFVAHVRELIEHSAARTADSDARVAELVLARTTRRDEVAAGRWRSLTRPLRERWRDSVATRVAAACLLIALPVCAWLAFDLGRGARDVARADRTPRVDTPPSTAGELGPPQLVDTADTDARLAAQARARQARELDGVNLRAAHVPLASAFAQPSDQIALLLWARSKQLENGSLDGVVITVGDSFEPLQVALSIEVLLDTWALTGRRPAALGDALSEFAAWSERIHDELALLAWERAESYGAVDELDLPQLAAVRRALRGDERAVARGDGTPLDNAWFDALAKALGARPHDAQGVLDAWLAAKH